jgi:hypothetical protein
LIIAGGLLALLLFLWLFYLPGYFVSRGLEPKATGLERHTLALVCSFSLVSLAAFLATVAAGIPLDRPALLLLCSAINVYGLFEAARARSFFPDIGRRDLLSLGGVAASGGLLLLVGLRSLDGGDLFSTLNHCLYVITAHTVANSAGIGFPFYDHSSGDIIHLLVHHPRDGFGGLQNLFVEQRLGNAAVLAPHIAAFGSAGWLSASLHATVILALSLGLAARKLGVRAPAAVLAAALSTVALAVFCGYTVNENSFAAALVAYLLWQCLNRDLSLGRVAMLGLVAGHLVGMRHTSSLFWPALGLALLWQDGERRERFQKLALGLGCALLTVAPWLYVNVLMLGNPFGHPKLVPGNQGRLVMNEILGMSFSFKALNWPFADTLVRAPWNPFPTLLWLPLWTAQCFGQLAIGAMALGSLQLRDQRRERWLLAAFFVPHTAMMLLLEGLDQEQLSYAVPGLVPLGLLLALGIDKLARHEGRYRSLAVVLGTVTAMVVFTLALPTTVGTADMRLLDRAQWQDEPEAGRGTRALSRMLRSFAPLPRAPFLRSEGLAPVAGALAALARSTSPEIQGGLPVYDSGKAAILTGYATARPTEYRFLLEGASPRAAAQPLRTALGLHTVTLQLKAKQLAVHVEHRREDFLVDLLSVGKSQQPRDFTFWINTWSPPARRIALRLDGRPVPGLRKLGYGGTLASGDMHHIATNYGAQILDVVTVPYRVETMGEPVRCGGFVFLDGDLDATSVETLVVRGGHAQGWDGRLQGELRVPRGLASGQVVLFSDPYCSDHAPQYGDHYAIARGPFGPEEQVVLRLDRQW